MTTHLDTTFKLRAAPSIFNSLRQWDHACEAQEYLRVFIQLSKNTIGGLSQWNKLCSYKQFLGVILKILAHHFKIPMQDMS